MAARVTEEESPAKTQSRKEEKKEEKPQTRQRKPS
jgi:hypothetical protein